MDRKLSSNIFAGCNFFALALEVVSEGNIMLNIFPQEISMKYQGYPTRALKHFLFNTAVIFTDNSMNLLKEKD